MHLVGHFRILYHDARKHEYQVYTDFFRGILSQVYSFNISPLNYTSKGSEACFETV